MLGQQLYRRNESRVDHELRIGPILNQPPHASHRAECREPRQFDAWLSSALRIAKAVNPYLAPEQARALWAHLGSRPCFASLHEFQRRWIALFHAVGARDAARMAGLAAHLLATQEELGADAREYLLMAAMAGYLAAGNRERALELWRAQADRVGRAASPAFRLLRCHAGPGDGCAETFRDYAER